MKRISLVLLLGPAIAAADPITINPGNGDSIDEDTLPTVLVERPRTAMVWQDVDLTTPAVNTHTIFLNRCASGCTVRVGSSNSINDTWPINANSVLTPFMYSDAVWTQVVSCVKTVFAPFDVTITDVDPGSAAHFEVMVAGRPADVGMASNIGGIAPFNCSSQFISNALVFDFANVWQGNVNEICSTAAQEIAHAWTMDHVTEPSDPMTYNSYSGMRLFKDGVQCGSDCVNGQAPFGQTCSGQNHTCTCSGNNIQNDVQIITALFGAGTPMPPVVTITSPAANASVEPGFPVRTTVTSVFGVSKVELRVDNTLTSTITSAPYVFNAPTSLGQGSHHVEVTAYDVESMTGKAAIDVVVGKPCGQPSDCPNQTDTCVGGRCVPGPGVQGGLGQPCTDGTDCASGQCASDGTNKYCVEPCTPGAGQCPSGFGCAMAGSGGVCFPGFDDGSGGGCSASGGTIGLGLVFAALLLSRRRRAG
jgi:uncharacterized protein (TIGR03382 family)